MKKILFILLIVLFGYYHTAAQDNIWTSGRFSQYLDVGSARNTNAFPQGLNFGYSSYTNFNFAHKTWSGSHAILFNSYMSLNQVNGSLGSVGNTKYANDVGAFGGGAGAIMFFGNGGTMTFCISPPSTGKDANVEWGTAKMTIRRDGNVGIGVSNPSERLEVDGTILAEEVKVQNVPSSDYVFGPTYQLRPINEVETFIKENKHLPDIPSAEEFKENGVGLGEMDNMLLRKVEELVLYTIEQQKELEEYKERLQNLENENKNLKKENEEQNVEIEKLKVK